MKYLIFLLLLTACGPRYYLKKAQRLEKRAIEAEGIAVAKGAKETILTVHKDTTIRVVTPGVRIDTVLKMTHRTDTVIVDRVRMIVTRDTVRKVERIRVYQKGDTVTKIVHLRTTITKTFTPPNTHTWRNIWATTSGVLFILLIIAFLLGRLKI